MSTGWTGRRWIAPLLVVLTVAGCGEETAATPDPEARHCRSALTWLAKNRGAVSVLEVRHWSTPNVDNVLIVFDFRPEGEPVEATFQDFLHCEYAPRSDPARGIRPGRVKAEGLKWHGATLPEKDVETINMAVSLLGG